MFGYYQKGPAIYKNSYAMNKIPIVLCCLLLLTGCNKGAPSYKIDNEYSVVSQSVEFLGNSFDFETPEQPPEVGSLQKISEDEISFVYASNYWTEESIEVEVGLAENTLIISMLEEGPQPAGGANYFLYDLVLDREITFNDYEIYSIQKTSFFNTEYYKQYPEEDGE